MIALGSPTLLAAPVDPDSDEARELIIGELSKPPYRAAEPSWFDRLASAFWDWLSGIEFGGAGSPNLIWALVAVLLIGGLIAVYFIFGAPRRNRRAAASGALFGEADVRDAATLRRSSRDAAASGDYARAIEEQFRAIARALTERAIVDTFPGTTATSFAASAARYFTQAEAALAASAHDFDDVRYLDRPGTERAYERMLELDAALQNATPSAVVDAPTEVLA